VIVYTSHQNFEHVIQVMQERLGEEITVDDMAQTAGLSKFHFTRVFRDLTGLTPGRFLSALRIHAAQRLLTSTELSVADITTRIGYSSVSTFSVKFKSAVGVAPTVYRARGGIPLSAVRADDGIGGPPVKGSVTVCGEVTCDDDHCAPVLVGLFPSAILQGPPVRCTVLPWPGAYALSNVPPGTWHILACSAVSATESKAAGRPAPRPDGILTGAVGPITFRHGIGQPFADLRLRPQGVLNPPVLFSPLDVFATAQVG
jgi:AraC-like DNA-binding protein